MEMETKLKGLHQYLIERLNGYVHAKKINATQAGGELILNADDRGNEGYLIANWRYDAGILVEQFPHHKISPATLFALIACWLTEFDPSRTDNEELAHPELDIEVNNEESADVLVKLIFEEPVTLVQDESGLVVWQGEHYRVKPIEIWIAEEGEITHATKHHD